MMRLQTYAGLSLMGTLAVVCHAFNSRGQFYPAMVYLSTSKICLVILLNMGLVVMCSLWQLTKKIFLGSLREAEVERLNEQSWREVMEILFAITIFRQDFSVTFLAMVTALLLIKALHWLAQKRIEYIETTPTVPVKSHIRIVSFLGFLLLIDSLFLYNSVKYLIETRQASVSLFFSFEYVILVTSTVSTFIKYVFHVFDMLMDGQWENRAVYTFYLELVRDLLHLSLYLCFFLVIFLNYGVPLHLIRELYETFRNFRIRVADYVRYRKITSNMNTRFPDATPEELNSSDATCIICREEMTTAKRLLCGHLFHVHCLRSWLERQHTCPTCRALVVPPETGTTMSGPQADGHQQGTSNTGSSSHAAAGDNNANGNVNHHQAKLQAAAAAAALYGRSFVYPSVNTPMWSPGYPSHPQTHLGPPSVNLGEEQVSAGQSQYHQFGNMNFGQIPPLAFLPVQLSGANFPSGERLGSNLTPSQSPVEAEKKFLENQIEVLQNQLQLLQKLYSERDISTEAASDSKGKAVSYSSASTSACSQPSEDTSS